MIIRFKIFEKINQGDNPEIGDYIVINSNDKDYEEYNNYIGKIAEIEVNRDHPRRTVYWTIFDNNEEGRRYIFRYEITHWSENKEDLEPILAAKKYNI